ncbi:SDR family NAD(P)-dependent oxidoreductase [Amycolatopsis silviterrae]|uniref:SDR family NAD(P)-dependent oxidoreductase n=1 Tax=Amycolatopsis silviterrae TaxID=1656914 RepID=A0ABW5HML9_9PSEU
MTGDRIAVVGLACRYPDATSPEQLWQNVLGRRRAFRRLPEVRLGAGYRGGPRDVDLATVSHAAVLRDWEFDRQRFAIPGPLYRAADQTHWLALETAAAALADAGCPLGEGLDRDTAGVIFGNSLAGEFTRAGTLRLRWPFLADAAATSLRAAGIGDDAAADVLHRLEELVKQPFPVPGDETLAGALANTIAGRVCNQFDFHGTGYTVDGACSSSLLAVMTACRALAERECDFMLAGGVDMSLDPFELVGFSRLDALAKDEMRVYDADPTGFLPGEGCGVVALMRAEDAERAGRRSYAQIVGWGSSSDGAGGLSRPERRGQVLALTRAYRKAGIEPRRAGLIEGHGTGTAVGDHVELRTLKEVLGAGAPAALGTVKANIGHTKAAAGVAGLIKAVLAVAHRVLPPTTGCVRPNELLRGARLRVLEEPEPWTDPLPTAGVSSMGFGGINAHVVLEGTRAEAPPVLSAGVRRWSARIGAAEIVYLGAGDSAGLAQRLDALAGTAVQLSAAEVGDLAATAWRTSGGGEGVRAALVARTPDELASAARAAARAAADWDGGLRFAEHEGYALGSGPAPRVGLLFPGQAAPVRPDRARWAERVTFPPLPSAFTASTDTAVAQPVIVWQSLAALAWLRELGTVVDAACGHSLGELTALHWAGACSAAEVLQLAAARGRIMAEHGIGETTMAGLAVTADDARPLLSGTDAVIAGYNAPEQIVVSGPREGVRAVLDRAAAAGVRAAELAVSHGFHSPAMRAAEGPLRAALGDLGQPARPVVSTVTGKEISATTSGIRELLVDQLTRPVLFSDAVAELARRCELMVEAGPGTMLTGLAAANGIRAVSMDCGGDERRHAFATAVLAAAGAADLDPWFAGRAFRTLPLDARPSFVANPCEIRNGWTSAAELPAGPRDQTGSSAAPARTEPGRGETDPLTALTGYLAAALELPPTAITPDATLLGDLHLNSLQVVQLVSSVADALDRQPPDTPLSLADATVGDAARVLAGLSEAGSRTGTVASIRPWVRSFEPRWVPFEAGEPSPVRWEVRAGAGHWLHESADEGEPSGIAVALRTGAGPGTVAALLSEIDARRPRHLFVVHTGHPAAAGLARSVSAEADSCSVTVVEMPDENQRVDPAALAGHSGYLELRCEPDGSLRRAVMVPSAHSTGAPLPLAKDDVCLVTGGVRGISAYVAAALARRTGCVLVLAGRTPARDPAVAEALAALPVAAHYVCADVADTAGLVAVASGFGPVRALIHGAGVNEPRLLGDVSGASLAETLRPKVSGLRALLDQLPGLRLVLGFGSIIGRQGLAGQAEYCVANDWLRVELERWAAEHPSCRTHVLEWSLWAKLGMGARMDVLDTLRRRGVEPIEPELGVRALFDMLADPGAPCTVLLASRFPASPTLSVGEPATMARFAERIPAHVPGVEAVLEADLALGSDPYLDEHRIDGIPVLPAVVGMEAMAQAASFAGGPALPLSLRDVEFRAPVAGERTIRVSALSEEDRVDVVLSDDAERFTAKVRAAGPRPPDQLAAPIADGRENPWYGSLFFHEGRFRRMSDYVELSAFRVRALINPGKPGPWFSPFHSGSLVLGDPAAHDATIHALLACVPHRRALPVGVARFSVWAEPSGPLVVHARETGHTADDYEFDAVLTRPDGTAVAGWQGLRLRATGELSWPDGLPARLVGPWLSRRLIETGLADDLEIVTTGTGRNLVAEVSSGTVTVSAGTAADGELAVDDSGGHPVITATTRVLGTAEPLKLTIAAGGR